MGTSAVGRTHEINIGDVLKTYVYSASVKNEHSIRSMCTCVCTHTHTQKHTHVRDSNVLSLLSEKPD